MIEASNLLLDALKGILKMVVEVSVDTGVADDTSTVSRLDDASKDWPVDAFKNLVVEITNGTGQGQLRKIKSNTATGLVPVTNFTTAPDGTSAYRIGFFGQLVTPSQVGQAPAGVNVTTSSTEVLATNTSRKAAVVVNDSDTPMWLAVGQTAVANQGIRLNASGGTLVLSQNGDLYSTQAINAIHAASGNKVATVQEMV